MQLSLYPYQLKFKFPFRITHGIRTYTDVVYVKLQHKNFVAWGEAALPPYLPETQKSVIEFLTAFSKTLVSNSIPDWFEKLENESGNMCAKAALDMALWNLKSQIENKSIEKLLGIPEKNFPLGAYTIGLCDFEEMKIKVDAAGKHGFELFKIKLNGENDEDAIQNFRKLSVKPFAVDVNQGWGNLSESVKKISWLKEHGCFLIEQPFTKNSLQEMALLKEESVLPLYADESCQTWSDLEEVSESFNGVNIKLMKCGGITEAYKMILKARELGLKVLVGCMSESSVGCTAAAHLTPLADYADLDGPYLISNDPFDGMKIESGRIKIEPVISRGVIP